MAWHGHLTLDYRLDTEGRTTAHDRHEGPLRVLQRLYPEGPAVCHHVLVHPPGGIVGGDTLDLGRGALAWREGRSRNPQIPRFHRALGTLTLVSFALALVFWLLRDRA